MGQIFDIIQPELLDQPLYVNGDHDRLRQIFDNLIDNAFKNTPPGKQKIIIEIGVTPEKIITTVTDNGAGINLENVERIFDKFVSFPTRYSTGSSGIGLYIS